MEIFLKDVLISIAIKFELNRFIRLEELCNKITNKQTDEQHFLRYGSIFEYFRGCGKKVLICIAIKWSIFLLKVSIHEI